MAGHPPVWRGYWQPFLLITQSIIYFLETIFGHKPDDLNYCNDWYPWKNDKKTKAPVNKKNGMDVWVKSSGQKMDYDFLKKNLIVSN